MKIAMMTNNYKPFIAGVPISVERLSDGLRANGHEVVVFAPDYEGQEEEKYIVRYRALIKGIVNGFSVPNSFDPHIERRFREGHFDVIHVHHPMLIGRTALYLSKKYRVPLCFTYHTRYEQYLHYIGAEFIQNAVPNYVNRYADKCDLVFAPTQSMQEYLEKNGCEVTYLDVDENGLVSPEAVKAAIRPGTILISVMMANNEIGTVEPIREIGEIAREQGILFHTDAVQAFGHLPINVEEMNIDLLSASAHKLNGPKGVGFLYIRQGLKLRAFLHGGAQERQRRAGTHNTAGIVGFGKAAELAFHSMEQRAAYETKLRDYLIERVLAEIPYTRLNGDRTKRLPGNASFCFRFIEGESLLILLDQNGICASSGSACTSGALEPSHVLLAIGLPHEIAHGSLRISLSDKTTKEEIDFTVDRIKEIVERLRNMSPLYEDFVKKNG